MIFLWTPRSALAACLLQIQECVCVCVHQREREYTSEEEGDAHLQAKWRSVFLNSLHY